MYGDLKNEGLDCGQEVGNWLEKVLHEDDQLGLLHYKDGLHSERWSHRGYRWFFGIAPIKDKIAFPYLAPYLCVSSASIEDVKSRLPDDKEISARNFRANIVIDGCAPFDEDWWMELKIGEVVFECYESCDR
ncbi:unnamed protein product [Anisakis simplex]|uniref:MOSC domain-containing protein n=1 Tax=Anisakis simplex TaxID=6269 RepID=A0A0M3JAI7_ANISI|nr:unnamed protein product [Anisakis simplex]